MQQLFIQFIHKKKQRMWTCLFWHTSRRFLEAWKKKKKIINQESGNILQPCFQLVLFIYFSFYLNTMVLFPLVTAGVDLDIPGLYVSNVSDGLWEGVWVCVSISESVHQLFFFF